MINWLIDAALRNRFLVIAGFLLLAGWGYWALLTTPIDAIPDLSDNQVIVFTDWPGRSPAGSRGPDHLPADGQPPGAARRAGGALLLGLRLLDDQRDLRGRGGPLLRPHARAGAAESADESAAARRRADPRARTPPGSGTSSGTRWKGQGYALRDLRSLQDWFIRYQLNAVPGVAEVASVGGVVRQYQIDVDPNRLRAFRIPLSAVVDAVMRSNRNVGGNVVEANGTWSVDPRARAHRERAATSSRSSSAPSTACRSTSGRSRR